MFQHRLKRTIAHRLSPTLAQTVLNGSKQEPIQVIMEFPTLRSCRSQRVREMILKEGGRIVYELPLINSLAVELPSEALLKVIPEARVKMVWPDANAAPCLDVAVPAVGADQAHRAGLTGKGVVVAVIDTGIAPHPDLMKPEPRIVGWHDLVNGKSEPYDDEGHGTHVAGIIAGNGYESGGKYTGVAPGALVVGVKVLDHRGSGPISRVIAGIQWVVEHKEEYRIKILNLSLGAPPEEGYRTDPASKAVEAAWRAGLLVCAAAGNLGPRQRTITTPGISPWALTVGSINDQGTIPREDDEINDFSSRGPTIDRLAKPDLVAPGANITSLKVDGGYMAQSGTSMATPVVAGAAALLWEKNPALTPNRVRELLVTTAEDRGYSRLIQGAGYLNISAALERLAGNPAAPPTPSNDLFFTFFLTLGLQFAPEERRQELLTVLSNHLTATLRKTGWLQTGDTSLYQEHLPQVLYALGECLFQRPAAES
ncbi:MAG TPA: S8 family peptidase [Firmicutes bacterium]|nr:S8 family peptidase [Bacillota bacterium]